ncbi:MAG TPA: dihydroorotate dehydrogenase, partial [Eubacteriaceae bacterium]|nr:dihydroorotate dehydrogenase [Eubacteriaceae bacterium]
MNKLETTLAGKKLKNPVIGASGTYGYGEDYKDFYPPDLLGGMATKGLTYHPKAGNRGIRIWETPSGLLNSIGLENPGVQEFVQETAAKLENLGTRIFVNLGGDCLQDYIQGAELLEGTDLDYIELNISCPNVKAGGMAFGMEAKSAGFITGEIKKVTNKPLIVKLSPNADSLTDVAKACEDHGADGLSLVNTFQGMAIDIEKKKPVFENVYAGLSGPAIK